MNHFAREHRVRDPVPGLRQRLRVALRAAGVTGKFSTDHLRAQGSRKDDVLIVNSRTIESLPLAEFEGRQVRLNKLSAR